MSKLLRNKGKLGNTIRESYARESFAREYSFYLSQLYISQSIFDDCFLQEMINHGNAVLVVLCNEHVWCEPRRAKGTRLSEAGGTREFWLQSEMPPYWPLRPLLVITDESRKKEESTAQCQCC